MSTYSSVVLNDLTFAWPDGRDLLTHVTGTFSHQRTGLIGANGTGKSTLLRLITGDLTPSGGTISVSGIVDYLPQAITRSDGTLADLLGISRVRQALSALEAGDSRPEVFEAIGDNWGIEAEAQAVLGSLGLPTDLDRDVASLSGGEAMLAALVGIQVRGADIALLDEPTNNLDAISREKLYGLIRCWRGTLIVVSHDLDLLELMDETAELRGGSLVTFGGPYSAYREWVRVQQDAAQQAMRTAEQLLEREKRERIKTEERIAHSQRQGRKDRENSKFPPIVSGMRKNAAEASQGVRRGTAEARVAAAKSAVAEAELAVRSDSELVVDLPDPRVHATRRILELPSADERPFQIRGPERVALIGPNGIGKTSLLESRVAEALVLVGYLPQRVVLPEHETVLEVITDAAPAIDVKVLRNRLARLLIRGEMVNQPIDSLSGGERFRVALARLILADPTPELLVLDEPTNDLDIESVDQLVNALTAYRGALLVVSHDHRFLARIALDHVLELDAEGVLNRRSVQSLVPAAAPNVT